MEPSQTPTARLQVENKESFWRDFFLFLTIILPIAIIFRIYIAQPFIVSGASMEPTFLDKQYLVVDEISYRFENPQRGDVVIFKFPLDTSKYFIKRIIGLPGDRVLVEGSKITIFNKENPNGLVLNEPYIAYQSDVKSDTTLKADEYFTMGDNREKSWDSRYWGVVPKKDLTGRALIRLFPFDKIGLFPGAETN